MKRLGLKPDALAKARALRRAATPAERALWRALRENFSQYHFRFQVPLGVYYADFASHKLKLIIEVDGDSHGHTQEYDAARTAFLEGEGYRVIRFWNNDVLGNLEGVLHAVAKHLLPQAASEN